VFGASKGLKNLGRYGSIGIELLASMALGYYLGRFLDRKLGTHWIALAGFLLGCAAGFRNLWRTAKKMERELEREDAKNPPPPPLL
jgi:ATP synthase protein I